MNNLNEEIELEKLFKALYKGKFLIIIVTLLFGIFSVNYSLSLPNEYTSLSKLKIAKGMDSGSNSFQQYSGIASMAGINLPKNNTDTASVAIATIQSRDFLYNLLQFEGVRAKLGAAISYDENNGNIIYDSSLFDSSQKKWVLSLIHI